jgi:hypothetical protein
VIVAKDQLCDALTTIRLVQVLLPMSPSLAQYTFVFVT